jgi:hypothetical protein
MVPPFRSQFRVKPVLEIVRAAPGWISTRPRALLIVPIDPSFHRRECVTVRVPPPTVPVPASVASTTVNGD